MAQIEILNYLKSKPNKMFSVKNVADNLNLDGRIVNKDIKKLGKYDFIHLEKNNGKHNKFSFGFMTK
jgi:DNA-binding MarR family transcriptional regulator